MIYNNSKLQQGVHGRDEAAMMRRCRGVAAAGVVMVAAIVAGQQPASAEGIRVELNAVESSGANRCRFTFVVENTGAALETLRLDLAAFGKDGVVLRRIAAELGPLRAGKTNVRVFDVEGGCDALGSVLVNDVAACAPLSAGDCLDRLVLSHRGAVRLFK